MAPPATPRILRPRAPARVRRWVLAAAALLLAAPSALAKPLFLVVEREFSDAVLIAEVRVLEVEIADWLGEDGRRGGVTVEVTSDPQRIFRGPQYLGRRLQLAPAPAGPQSCTAELNLLRGSAARVLLVVDADHVIRLGGGAVEEADGGGEDRDAYRMRGWCDYNACMLRASTPGLALASTRVGGSTRIDIAREKLAELYEVERAPFWGMTARFLAHEEPGVDAAQVVRCLAAVGSGEPAKREAAQEVLVERGVLHVSLIGEAARTATDPETRRCLEHVLRRLEVPVQAYHAAVRLADAPRAARRHVAQAGLPVLDGASGALVRDYLERLERAEEDAAR